MRIVLTAVRYPPAPGGAETHVHALATGLLARGHDVEVYTTDLATEVPFRRDPDLPTAVDGVPVRRFPARTPGGEAHYVVAPGLAPAIHRAARDADVLHTHSYGYSHTLFTAAAARLTSTPLVFTPHYHPPWSMEGGARRGHLRRVFDASLGPWSLKASDAVVAVSSNELALMRDVMGLALPHARVIPNGIRPERFRDADGARFRKAHGLDDGPVVAYAGRLAVNKGLPHLVDAMVHVRRAVPDASLLLMGTDQGLRPQLEAQAADLGVPVAFAGHVTDDEYPHALAAGDVFALASDYEAFGIVLAEAMAAGVPVVATRVGGVPDVVTDGENGLLVPYGDAAALGDALARVLTDDALADRLVAAGRVRAADLGWDRVVADVEALYEELLRR